MSDAWTELDKTPKNANKDVKWGAWASIFVGVSAYMLPQILIVVVLVVYVSSKGLSIDEFLTDTPVQNLLFSIIVASLSLALIFSYVNSRGGIKALGLSKFKAKDLKSVLLGYGVYFISFIVAMILVGTLAPAVDLDQQQELGFQDPLQFIDYVYTFIALVLIAPFYEEILFRGFAFQGFAKAYGFIPAAIVVSGVFGVAHGQLNVGIDTFLLGLVASWLVWKTKRLWPAILLHALKNLIAFVLRFIIL